MRILDARGVPWDCPVCGERKWAPMGALSNMFLAIPLMDDAGQRLQEGEVRADALALAFVCGNCAFMKLLSEDMLLRLSETPPEGVSGT